MVRWNDWWYPTMFSCKKWSSLFQPQLFLLYFLLFRKILSQPLGRQPFYAHTHCARCPAKFGVVSICNATHGTLCSPCTEGSSYSPADDHLDSCQPCSLCAEGLFVQTKCTTTSNTICSSCRQEEQVSYSWEYYRQCLLHRPRHPSFFSRAASPHLNSFLLDAQQRPSNPHTQQESFVSQPSANEHPLILEKDGLPGHKPLQNEKPPHAYDILIFSTELPAGAFLIDNVSTKFAKNPDTVLAIVLLTTFFALGCASFFAVILLVYLKRRRIINSTYGGVKVIKEGTARLLTSLEPSGDPYDDDEAII